MLKASWFDVILAVWSFWGLANILIAKGIIEQTPYLWYVFVFPILAPLEFVFGPEIGLIIGVLISFVSPIVLIVLIVRVLWLLRRTKGSHMTPPARR